nr:MAG TPA: hypothetical protein [Caudoviricetes sp.]
MKISSLLKFNFSLFFKLVILELFPLCLKEILDFLLIVKIDEFLRIADRSLEDSI